MFGSDWPVCLLAAGYARVVDLARSLAAGLSAAERAAVFTSTAVQAYRLAGPGRGDDGAGDGGWLLPTRRSRLGDILSSVDVNSPVDDFVAADLEFHRTIAVGSGNSVLASLVDNMSTPTARARVWRGMTEPHALEKTLGEHRAIYDAIISRDQDAARSWASIHIAGIESWLRLALAD